MNRDELTSNLGAQPPVDVRAHAHARPHEGQPSSSSSTVPSHPSVVRIERDYSNGVDVCQFWPGWLWELEGRVSPLDYQNTLNELNDVLASAYNARINAWYNLLAVLTLYVSTFVISSHYERVSAIFFFVYALMSRRAESFGWQEMKRFDQTFEALNERLFNPARLNLLHPSKNGWQFVSFRSLSRL